VIDSVLEDMKGSLKGLEKVQLAEEREMFDLEAQLEDACEKLERVGKASTTAEGRCAYFKNLRKYFVAFSDCMEEKLKMVNDCEQRMKTLWKKRGNRMSVRRRWIQNNVLRHAGLQGAFAILSSKDIDDETKEYTLHQHQNWSAIDLFRDAENALQGESGSFKTEIGESINQSINQSINHMCGWL
jgi:hypothetical protein